MVPARGRGRALLRARDDRRALGPRARHHEDRHQHHAEHRPRPRPAGAGPGPDLLRGRGRGERRRRGHRDPSGARVPARAGGRARSGLLPGPTRPAPRPPERPEGGVRIAMALSETSAIPIPGPAERIRVLIAEDEPAVRSALADLLASVPAVHGGRASYTPRPGGG